jgi:predicted dinucleotide-binding enzyme
MVPAGVRVAPPFHTVSAATLGDPDHAPRRGRPDLRRPQGRQGRGRAALVEKIEGPAPGRRGRLEQARIVESLTALMIGMNARYKTHAGVRVTGLPAELCRPRRRPCRRDRRREARPRHARRRRRRSSS